MIATLLAIALALTGGSDSPTPYTVDQSGITLPAGQALEDNGHINVRTESGTVNLHAESKCIQREDAECAGVRHEQAQFIGQSFIPWSAFGLVAPFCVEWVQWSGAPEHFGEGGQAPVCVGAPTPEPTPPESPTPTESPTPGPTDSPEPTPTPTPEPPCDAYVDDLCVIVDPPPLCLDGEELSNNICVTPDPACPDDKDCKPPVVVVSNPDCDRTKKAVLACTGDEYVWRWVSLGLALIAVPAILMAISRLSYRPKTRATKNRTEEQA